MNNYVLLYFFDKKEQEQQFEQKLKKQFAHHKFETDGPYKYFAFASTEEPGVADMLDSVLNSIGIGVTGNFGQQDYVALYFSRAKDPDNIKRQLIIGTDEMVNKGAQSMATDAHRDTIQNLLALDFRKVQQ